MKTFNLRFVFSFFVSFACFYGSSQTISTVAGNGTGGYSGDGGPATAASLNNPWDVCFDASGNMYIADKLNHRIRKVTPGGTISTFAGTGAAGYSGDGGQATSAQLNNPWFVDFDNTSGSLYISDGYNFAIRKVNAQGVISTVAGTGSVSAPGRTFGGQATATKIYPPGGVVIGPDKKLYFGEWNASYSRVLVVDTFGIINIFAGNNEPPNVPAFFKTTLWNPRELMFDPSGNLYICDGDNYRIRKINTTGVASIYAGTGSPAAAISGNGGAATSANISMPNGICRDAAGMMYFSSEALTIRTIDQMGIINPYAGVPNAPGPLGDGGPILQASIITLGIAFGPNGNMYIADGGSHHRVRSIGLNSSTVGVKNSVKKASSFLLYPNPASSVLNFQTENVAENTVQVVITDLMGELLIVTTTNDLNALKINLDNLNSGLYYISLRSGHDNTTQKFIKE